MEVRIGGLVHVVASPFLEAIRVDGATAVLRVEAVVEIVARAHLQEAISLPTH